MARTAVVVRSNVSASSENGPSPSRRAAVLSGLALAGLVLPAPRPGLAQAPEVTAGPSKKFVDSVLEDPELRKKLGGYTLFTTARAAKLLGDSRGCHRMLAGCQVNG